MNLEQLIEVMKYHLINFNDEGVEINDETFYNAVLGTTNGFVNPILITPNLC